MSSNKKKPEQQPPKSKPVAKRWLIPKDPIEFRKQSLVQVPAIPQPKGYRNRNFVCKDCGIAQVWTVAQQKWWYEEAGGTPERIAVRCHECRVKERARRDEARRIHLEGLERKKREREKNAGNK
jgi:hypothetical protein